MTEIRPRSHRRIGPNPRWLAAAGAVVLAAIVGVALILQNGGSACASPPATSGHSGKATFYDLDGGTPNCSYPSAPDDDLFVALGPSEYSNAAACGTYLDVTGPEGKVRVKVVDKCPECDAGHLDLSRTAFKKIGAESAGVIPITYKTVVNPATPGPLSVRMQEGTSQYYWSALIDNHGNQLSSVKVAGPGGTFHTAERADYNDWIIDGGAGSGPFKIKISDVYGRTATLSGISLSPEKTQKSSARLSGGGTVETPHSSSPTPAKKKSPSPAKSSAAPTTASVASSAAPLPAADTTAPADTSLDLAGAAATSRCH
ncbi:expansin EXLX1 family cellulose-binding protein [Actinoplanes sp. NPDC051411]|uniref:expansin EXLX1 family cellulose-binding protein n=1 Tax=Actinoplanes sp. NPDC051411 TaxID=3155522 RepID=UPI00343FD253